MAVVDSNWQSAPSQQILQESRDCYNSDSTSPTCTAPKPEAHGRAMQPGLKFQDNRSLLQGEDVEVFFKNLEAPEGTEHQGANSNDELEQTVPEADINSVSVSTEEEKTMFQNSMHAVPPMAGSTPTYDTTGTGTGAMTSIHSGVNPVYVPTTRPVLPPMHYMTNGASQGVSTPNSPAMWPMNSTDPSYSVANPHSSVSPRFAFAPSPSSPISTPTARTDSSFTSPLARPSGINPYHTYMGTPEISSAWNFQMALQQGFRQTGPGRCRLLSVKSVIKNFSLLEIP